MKRRIYLFYICKFISIGGENLKIVGGPSSLNLACKISEVLNVPLIKVRTKRFPDGEFYFKFEENISGENVLIVQSLYPPQDMRAMELFLILHTARDLGADTIKVFVPYLAYSRQDERFLDGECLSASMMAEIIEELGADALYTVDVHNENVLKMYKIPVYNLTASGELARYFARKDLENPFIIAPDDEDLAIRRAKHAAEVLKTEYDALEKRRDRYTGEIVTYKKDLRVRERDAIIIDDIISTGKTVANAARILKEQGARRILVGVSHALLIGDSVRIMMENGVEEIVGTDSVINEYAKVSVAPVLARALRGEVEQA
ncbi:MAG: ribose-phosphate diphosphokinase [Candidatus Bathyarchaeia archaeon]|nr:ribose-phosphate diphosphokinase [Candidatus Bathyarchaeota archaeon]